MAMIEREADDTDELPWPAEADGVGAAVSQLIACVFEAFPTDCPERRAALCTVIEAHTRAWRRCSEGRA
jgi:hypothetical protein